jgi:hypothetical protein
VQASVGRRLAVLQALQFGQFVGVISEDIGAAQQQSGALGCGTPPPVAGEGAVGGLDDSVAYRGFTEQDVLKAPGLFDASPMTATCAARSSRPS